jgi:hypothetical protein
MLAGVQQRLLTSVIADASPRRWYTQMFGYMWSVQVADDGAVELIMASSILSWSHLHQECMIYTYRASAYHNASYSFTGTMAHSGEETTLVIIESRSNSNYLDRCFWPFVRALPTYTHAKYVTSPRCISPLTQSAAPLPPFSPPCSGLTLIVCR